MKTTQLLLCLFTTVTLMWEQSATAQQIHNVVLRVNTQDIQNPNVNDYCSFEGQEPGVSNEDYMIVAAVGDTVVWSGVSTSNPADQVIIESINYVGDKGGRNVFGSNRLEGQNGTVTGVIQNSDGGTPYKYMLTFRVLNSGQARQGVYNIDPKIRVN